MLPACARNDKQQPRFHDNSLPLEHGRAQMRRANTSFQQSPIAARGWLQPASWRWRGMPRGTDCGGSMKWSAVRNSPGVFFSQATTIPLAEKRRLRRHLSVTQKTRSITVQGVKFQRERKYIPCFASSIEALEHSCSSAPSANEIDRVPFFEWFLTLGCLIWFGAT
jgi:hypothetical protein